MACRLRSAGGHPEPVCLHRAPAADLPRVQQPRRTWPERRGAVEHEHRWTHLPECLSQCADWNRRRLHAVRPRRVPGHRPGDWEGVPGRRIPELRRHLQLAPQHRDTRHVREPSLSGLPDPGDERRSQQRQPHPHRRQPPELARYAVHGAVHGHGPQPVRGLGAQLAQHQARPTAGLRERGLGRQRLGKMEYPGPGERRIDGNRRCR